MTGCHRWHHFRRADPFSTGVCDERAADVPDVVSVYLETPTALNPLGVKGVGEAGTVGAMSATTNAVCHALQVAGIRHLDMPATPMRVWQALQDAGYQGR